MGAINTSVQLAKVRSKMDAQQQVVALLETELQQSILGEQRNASYVMQGVRDIYAGISHADGQVLLTSLENNLKQYFTPGGNGSIDASTIDQDLLRQMLYQARALLGELRIEEQHYNQEVQQEQSLRKSLIDLSKA